MGAYIIMRTEVLRENLQKFIDVLAVYKHHVARIYDMDDIYDIIFEVNYLGYAEPGMLYDDIKNYVVDVWYNCIGDDKLIENKDSKSDWHSCKKEWKEDNEVK